MPRSLRRLCLWLMAVFAAGAGPGAASWSEAIAADRPAVAQTDERGRPIGVFDPNFLSRLTAAQTPRQIKRILLEVYQSEAERKEALRLAFSLCSRPEDRRCLLQNDPWGEIADLRTMVAYNDRSWSAYLKVASGELTRSDQAAHDNRLAMSVAEFHENPVAVAWCRLQQALILQAQDNPDEALAAARLAWAEFERRSFVEGEAAAQVILGRLAAARGDKTAARAAFDFAERLFPGIVPISPSPQLLDSEQKSLWLASEHSLGKRWAGLRDEGERMRGAARRSGRRTDWADACDRCRDELRVAREIYGPWHQSLIDAWSNLAAIEWCRGDLARALDAMRQSWEIADRLYDDRNLRLRKVRTDLKIAQELNDLEDDRQRQLVTAAFQLAMQADALVDHEQFDAAIGKLTEAIRRHEEALGAGHLLVAFVRIAHASACRAAGDADGALDSYRRAVVSFDRAGEAMHPAVLDSLYQIAVLQTDLAFDRMNDGELQAAVLACTQVIEAYRAAADETGAEAVSSRESAAALLRLQESAPDVRQRVRRAWMNLAAPRNSARPERQREIDLLSGALADLEPIFGPESEFVTEIRVKLAAKYRYAGQTDQAVEQLNLARRVLELRALPAVRPVVGDVYLEQVMVSLERGELRSADEALHLALAALSQSRGRDWSGYLGLLHRSARFHMELGDYSVAETDALQAMLIFKRRLIPPDHPGFASPFASAELEDDLPLSGPAAYGYIRAMIDVGEVRSAAGHPELAQGDFETALRLAEKLNSPSKEYLVLRALKCLGRAQQRLDRPKSAEELLRKALEIETRHGTETLSYVDTANTLAQIMHAQGKLQEALALYCAAVAVVSRTPHARSDVRVAETWINLAACQASLGDRRQALESLKTALPLYDHRLDQVSSFRAGSRTWHARGDLLRSWHALMTLAMAAEAKIDDVTLAWNWSLRIKGRALETLMRTREAQRRLQHDPAVARLTQRCIQLANQISELALNPPPEATPASAQAHIERLGTELDRMLGELNRAALRARIETPAVSLAELQKRLPDRTALLEFVRIQPCDWSAFGRSGRTLPERYLVFVLPPGSAAPELIDLGSAAAIDLKIEHVRTRIRDLPKQLKSKSTSERTAELGFQEDSQDLYQAIFGPIRQRLGDADTIYLLPDRELQRVAFETLVDASGHYLIEEYRFAYLTSAGDLLRATAPAGEGTCVFADPDYDLNTEERADLVAGLISDAERGALSDAVTPDPDAVRGERGKDWEPLQHAPAEMKAVRCALDDSVYGPIREFKGPEALEEVLKSLHSPRILHLATHGFFVKDLKQTDDVGWRIGTGASIGYERLSLHRNPFLRSGLVLAGANRLGQSPVPGAIRLEDGWVTAEEIAALDLQGTELVVLSACETGLGDVRTGEGVHGLRQAFLYAGARTVVTSLYRVPDEGTQQLMQEFYTGLKEKRGVLTSLREAQLELLRTRREKTGAAHPYYWGSFIVVGNPQ